MKTLKEICAQHGYYTFADIPAKWVKSERYADRVLDKGNVSTIPKDLVAACGTQYEVAEFYECCTQNKGKKDEYNYIESYTTIFVKRKDSTLVMRLYLHRKMYSFAQARFQTYGVVHGTFRHTLKEPNEIGTFTTRKVDDWYNHLTESFNAALVYTADIESKNKQIEKQIAATVKSLRGCRVRTDGGQRTWIITKLFEITYTHHKDRPYLQTEVQFKGTIQDLIELHTKKR